MKNSHKLLALAAASVALAASAFGDTLVLSTSSYSNGSNGGSYTASAFGTGLSTSSYVANVNGAVFTATSFETFCLEPTEYFSPGNTYNYTIDAFAFGGANEAVSRDIGPGDQLSVGTTWLYSQFAKGTLSTFNYSNGSHQASNLDLQRAIWWLEDETQGSLTAAYSTLLIGQFGSTAAAQANAANGANGVWALNLTSLDGNGNTVQNQSQLYYHVGVPDNASTIALLGLALIGFAGFRRKFAK